MPTSGAPSSAAVPTIDGIPCDPSDHEDGYHVHAHLNFRLEGALQEIPADIGIGDGCGYWIHTHANHGLLHVEAASVARYTLGQFFAIWGKPLTSRQVGDVKFGPGQHLFVFLGGQPFDGDPRSIELVDHASIEIQIGMTRLPPLDYTFPPGY